MVMNKLWKTREPARALSEMAFLCVRKSRRWDMDKKTVKQRWPSGTSLHKTQGITPDYGGKTRFNSPVFCERNA
jgi:hypothetical protein